MFLQLSKPFEAATELFTAAGLLGWALTFAAAFHARFLTAFVGLSFLVGIAMALCIRRWGNDHGIDPSIVFLGQNGGVEVKIDIAARIDFQDQR